MTTDLVLDIPRAPDLDPFGGRCLRYKAELIRPEGPWREVEHVELETLNWVDFFNNERPHGALDDLTPMRAEELHYAARNELTPTG